ncbi:A/G-specific adenine glycosylase [Snodgrassella communis]|uniref:Adenine DNA glycosylase n=1 Tax=Snodgrassella communis TaxID=2946699 RepID=A0A066TVB9_9NEIS|nr:A/G-specific adenine glycosylase [Snodgrassella communis]KDN13526.1 A/G-specific adenine glycosylase [Snodgrassella communis]KDN15819.1 A/G-specific adenine glycosylase [Snodgrassella communis]PIT12005.1 A/G-specific adenine glycosylase [Snodgrassella communis]PIT28989.1 A/G-specific adenine glycosylase [Snodgrassella communis]PIT29950.1 A/G-specific adenine glycosylase [Snodgrassella communis]
MNEQAAPMPEFALRLVEWQRQYGRHGLPWQTREPYLVWLSEIMLQQTQVTTVLDYYPRFVAAFPNVQALAAADEDMVMGLWQGLGYYSRARNLHKAARQVVTEFAGKFPRSRIELQTLCGVGRSTAAAIAAFCFNARETILDGNVKRVLCRLLALDGDIANKKFEEKLWCIADALLPQDAADMPAYIQGLMDMGATVCKRSKPVCSVCPMSDICMARAQDCIAELPRKKTAVAVRNMSLYWLVLCNGDGAVFLHKRPAKGIWGGLWCVPCVDSLAALYELAAQFGIAVEDLNEDAEISHRLTHRQLLILPFKAQADCQPIKPTAIVGEWVLPDNLAAYGIPKPLHDYLNAVQDSLF